MKIIYHVFVAAALMLAAQPVEAQNDEKIKVKLVAEVDGKQEIFEGTYDSKEEMKNDPELQAFKAKIKGGDVELTEDMEVKVIKIGDGEENVFIHENGDHSFKFQDLEDGTMEFKTGEDTYEIIKDDAGKLKVFKNGEEVEPGDDKLQIHLVTGDGEEIFKFEGADGEDQQVKVIVINGEGSEERHKVKVHKIEGEDGMKRRVEMVFELKEIHLHDVKKKDEDLADLKFDNKKNLQVNDFNYYPNPSEGVLNLSFKAQAVPTEIRITDLNGKVVYNDQNPDFNGIYDQQINLSGMKEGIYLLQVIQNDKTLNKKLVIK